MGHKSSRSTDALCHVPRRGQGVDATYITPARTYTYIHMHIACTNGHTTEQAHSERYHLMQWLGSMSSNGNPLGSWPEARSRPRPRPSAAAPGAAPMTVPLAPGCIPAAGARRPAQPPPLATGQRLGSMSSKGNPLGSWPEARSLPQSRLSAAAPGAAPTTVPPAPGSLPAADDRRPAQPPPPCCGPWRSTHDSATHRWQSTSTANLGQ